MVPFAFIYIHSSRFRPLSHPRRRAILSLLQASIDMIIFTPCCSCSSVTLALLLPLVICHQFNANEIIISIAIPQHRNNHRRGPGHDDHYYLWL